MGQFSWECCVVKGSEGERFFEKPAESLVSGRAESLVSGRAESLVSYRESGISRRGADFPVSGRAVIEAEE